MNIEGSNSSSIWDYSQSMDSVHNVGREGEEQLKGDDQIIGSKFSDTLDGSGGDDTIWGGKGKDILHGGEGDDQISGGKGKDYLDGGAGDDTMWGGKGQDTMTGGEGGDTFVLGAKISVITDFNSEEGDRLQLVANKRFKGLMNDDGTLRQGVFTTVATYCEMKADTNHQLFYNTNTGLLLYRDANGAVTEVAELTNKANLSAEDIFVAQKPSKPQQG